MQRTFSVALAAHLVPALGILAASLTAASLSGWQVLAGPAVIAARG